jgi:haloalkane dehalogenase
MIVRKLSKEEIAFYGEPYKTPKSRFPLWRWPQDVPFADGEPTEATKAVKSWSTWLASSEIPKLCFYVTPGVAIKEKDVKVIRDTFKNTEMIHLGKGLHFIQEDYPHEIGQGISKWYDRIN